MSEMDAASYLKEMSVLIAGDKGKSDLPPPPYFREDPVEPWEALARYLMAFQLMMMMRAGRKNELCLPFGETPSDAIEQQCDAWIAGFLAAKDRSRIVPPPALLKWLTARGFAASLGIQFEQDEGAIPPDVKNDLAGELKKQLIDNWHSRMKQHWPHIEPHPGDPGHRRKKPGRRS